MYKLYKLNSKVDKTKSKDFQVKKFKPNLFSLSINRNEQIGLKSKLVRLYFYIITKGDFEIYYVENAGCVIHTSYVLGKCFKFKFMQKGDIEIGPCQTNKNHRGKGIYPNVLNTICYERFSLITNIYIFVDKRNVSSIRGIEKSNFELVGNLQKGKFNIYHNVT